MGPLTRLSVNLSAKRVNLKDLNIIIAGAVWSVVIVWVFCTALQFMDVFRLLGVLAFSYGLIRACLLLYKMLALRPVDPAKFGAWAVVTGCTGGLGREFAHRCARRGLNLVLISRSRPKLEALASELNKTYGVEALFLVFDFDKATAAEDEEFYGRTLPRFVAASPVSGSVGLLVNNVGVGDEAPMGVDEIKTEDVASQVKVNCGATVNMSRALLPLLKHRKGGAVINVSSGSASQPTPFLATYSATKAFVSQFSASCNREYGQFGVHVMCILPFYIANTGLYPTVVPSLNAPLAASVVDAAFAHLGKYETTHGFWFHAYMNFMFKLGFEDEVLKHPTRVVCGLFNLESSMGTIQMNARARSGARNPRMWKQIHQKGEDHLRNLGIIPVKNLDKDLASSVRATVLDKDLTAFIRAAKLDKDMTKVIPAASINNDSAVVARASANLDNILAR